jgi:pimeloyl-ACP methyl ester carboxylesterase
VVVAFLILIVPFLIPVSTSGVDAASLDNGEGRFVQVRGLRTYVVERGPGTGRVVLFVHGLFGSTYAWRHVLDPLATAGYRAIAFDRPAFGLTDKPATFDYSPPAQADFIAALMDELGLQKVVIAGHSAGGSIVTHFAVRHPDRLEGLVLVAAGTLAPTPPALVGSVLEFAPIKRWAQIGGQAYFTRGRLRDTINSFYAPAHRMTDADAEAYYRAFLTPGWDVALLGVARDLAGSRLAESEIAGITAPTLLIWGSADTVTPLANAEQLKALIPGATLNVIPDSGHQPMEESPQAFNALLIGWLDQ